MKLPKMEISKNHVTDKYKIWGHTMQDIPTIMEDMCSQMHNVGNNRIVADAHGNVEGVNHYYPYGALMGDSRNTGLQPYKYIGKELDRTHGLDWYDYGARHYAPCPPIPLLNFRLARPRHRRAHADQR